MIPMRRMVTITLLVACVADKDQRDSGPAHMAHGSSHTGVDPSTDVLTSGESWRVSYTTDPSPIPLSEPFDVTFTIMEQPGGEPVPGVGVVGSGWMPDHGHGMTVEPETVDNGDGRYTVSVMLFHMEGMWDLTAEVTDDAVTETATFHVVCCD